MFVLILDREEGRQRDKREKHGCERQKYLSAASCLHPTRGQTCNLTRNQTGDLQVHGTVLSQLSHAGRPRHGGDWRRVGRWGGHSGWWHSSGRCGEWDRWS